MASSAKGDISFNHENNFVEINFSGRIKGAYILSIFEEVVSSEQYKSGMSRIWDMSDADLSSLDPAMVEELSRCSLSHPIGTNLVKVAVVSSKGINMIILKLLKAYSRDLLNIVETFSSIQDAMDWVIN